MPLVSPEKVQVRALMLVQPIGAVTAGEDVTVYPVIGEPPFDTGATQVTTACEFPRVAETPVGAPGIVRGVMAAEATDSLDEPAIFVATTVKVYAVPLANPVTVHDVAVVVVHESAPGDEVTVYPVIGDPPFDTGAFQVTVASAFPGVALTLVGAPGIVRGVMDVDSTDAGELPAAFTAITVKVYAVPLLNPEKVHERFKVFVQSAGAVTAGDEVTKYPVILAPPLDTGALHEMEA